MNKQLSVITIGVYGCTQEVFFEMLQSAEVDTFVDIRQRRGVRGSQYAFVNSKRLQARLAELGIRYLHCKNLAPTKAIREQQHAADKANKIGKRSRNQLGDVFIEAYKSQILSKFDPQTLIDQLPADAKVIALFCVEREPQACHRSLVAEAIASQIKVDVTHLIPQSINQ